MLVHGLTGESDMVVRDEDLVSHVGNIDVKVLSTPRLIQLMEAAAVKAIEGFLPPGTVSLGTQVRMKHLAATPLGMKVRAHALLKSVEKNRLLFLVDAHDEAEKVAEGEHERVLVPRESFLRRVEKKAVRKG